MCAPDPNAGVRMQAKMRNKEKWAWYDSQSIKYWNRETSYVRGTHRIGMGLSRRKSDAHRNILAAIGKTRQESAKSFKAYAQKKILDEGTTKGLMSSRSSKFGLTQYQGVLDKQAQLESMLDSTMNEKADTVKQGIQREYYQQRAKNREKLGVRPEFGSAVYMPPKDTAGQMWANIQLGLSIASLFVPKSDIRAKENIVIVGKSKDGHNVYEWNYKTDKNTRYRGVIAQDVVKIDPMAVAIRPDGYLGVHYDKIDVDMEVVS